MATKDWNGFKKSGDTYIPNDATARAGLQNKVDKVTGKGLSTNDYDNTAKGIVDNIQDNVIANTKLIKDTVGWSGKNKCPRFLNFSQGNVVFTVDGNGVVDITTSAAVSSNVWNIIDTNLPVFENGKKYKVSGLGTSTNQDGYVVGDDNGTDYVYVHDIGNGGEFTYDSSKPLKKIQIGLRSGQTASHIKLSPMIYDADILDDTYEPYAGSTAFPRSEQAVLGAKNLLPNKAVTKTEGNVTFTVNSDKSVTIKSNGATIDNRYLVLGYFTLPKGSYILNHGHSIESEVHFSLYLSTTDNVVIASQRDDESEAKFTVSSDTVCQGVIRAHDGKTIDNMIVYPMLRLATDPDDTYVPYAMTNRELTEKAQGIINAAINATDFASFKTALGNL